MHAVNWLCMTESSYLTKEGVLSIFKLPAFLADSHQKAVISSALDPQLASEIQHQNEICNCLHVASRMVKLCLTLYRWNSEHCQL